MQFFSLYFNLQLSNLVVSLSIFTIKQIYRLDVQNSMLFYDSTFWNRIIDTVWLIIIVLETWIIAIHVIILKALLEVECVWENLFNLYALVVWLTIDHATIML